MRTRILKDECGQVMALTVLSMFLLFACIAFAVDVSMLFRAKRNAQIAADAAAVAGALELDYNGSTNVVSKAKQAALVNGIPNSSVTVINGPAVGDGYHTGTGFVEVRIDQPTPTVFMSVSGYSTIGVGARAVAGIVPGPACFYVLDSSKTDTNVMDLQGNSTITSPNCGIVIDSPNADALCVTGGSNTVTAPYLFIVGGQNPGGHCSKTPQGGTPIDTGVLPQNDPFGNLQGPTPPKNTGCTKTVAGTQSIGAVTYGGGYGTVTCFTGAVTLTGTTLNPGTFVFENGLSLSGTVTAGIYSTPNTQTTNGATLDIEQGTFNQNNAKLYIYAPQDTSNTYNSIALMQPQSNTTGTCQDPKTTTPCLQVQFGSSYGDLSGYVYAPWSELYMQDDGGGPTHKGVQVAGVIAYKLYNKTSNLVITNSFNKINPGVTALNTVELVE